MDIAAESLATAYAAVVATLAFGLEVRGWFKERPKLDVRLVPNGAAVGGGPSDEDNILIVHVVNRGGTSTTMENLFLFEYEGRWSRWRGRPKRSFIVPNPQTKGYPPNLPSQLEPNRRWTGIVRKGQLTFDLQTGDFYVGIGASHSKRYTLKRIPRKPKDDQVSKLRSRLVLTCSHRQGFTTTCSSPDGNVSQ